MAQRHERYVSVQCGSNCTQIKVRSTPTPTKKQQHQEESLSFSSSKNTFHGQYHDDRIGQQWQYAQFNDHWQQQQQQQQQHEQQWYGYSYV